MLPRLYPIADIDTLCQHGLALDDFARQVVAGGAGILQLRAKRGSPQRVLAHAAAIDLALEGSGCLLVMNDRADLAVLAGWRAVHVGHRDLPPEAVRLVFGLTISEPSGDVSRTGRSASDASRDATPEDAGSVIVGVSTHTDRQVEAADAGPADYIAVGPVFATGSKADAEPVIGLEGVRRARALTGKPIVAIGGISLANAVEVIEAGADSVAVIGALFAETTGVEQTVRDFLRRLR